MSRLGAMGHGLYTGQVSYDFVGRWRRWLALSGIVMVIGIVGLGVRGLNLGLEFKGGSLFSFDDHGYSTSEVVSAVTDAGIAEPVVQKLTPVGSGAATFRVETRALDTQETDAVVTAITSHLKATNISTQTVGSSWGQQITNKAIQSLIIFVFAIVVYLSLRYDWKMAAAAIIALIHDLIITVGIYALVGFEVSPSTVIGLLTILGYSLYDTVVVFDKVRENTHGLAGGSRMTYSDAANLAVNQTLVRSINTSVTALLPVASLLFVGGGLLGAGSLEDLALALFIGLATGTYSSIFIATPLLGVFKEREPQLQSLAKRVAARQTGAARTPVAVGARASADAAAPIVAQRPGSRRPSTAVAAPDGGSDDAPDDAPDGVPDEVVDDDAAAPQVPPSVPSPGAGRTPPPSVRRPNAAQRRPGGRPSGKKKRR
jgi:preprotein translocase subunit SecF